MRGSVQEACDKRIKDEKIARKMHQMRAIAQLNKMNGKVSIAHRFRERLFCLEYVKLLDGTKAAIAVGYAPGNAGTVASRLINANEEYIASLLEEKLYEAELKVDEVLAEMKKLAFSNPADLFDEDGNLIPIRKLPRHVAAAVASFDTETKVKRRGKKTIKEVVDDEEEPKTKVVKVKLHNKHMAIETLMKYFGLLTEKRILLNPDGSNIMPNKIVHEFDPSNLSAEQLDALVVLMGRENLAKDDENTIDCDTIDYNIIEEEEQRTE